MALKDDEKATIAQLRQKLENVAPRNAEKFKYYDGKKRVQDLGISVPERLAHLEVVAGWPATTTDVLDERLNLESFGAPDALELDEAFEVNNLETESSLGHIDALATGVGFIMVGKGDPSQGEPEQLITVESPNRMTANYNARSRRLESALAGNWNDSNQLVSGTLCLLDANIRFERKGNGQLYEVDRDEHNFGRVTVARLVNRPRSSQMHGRSEITRAIRYYTMAAMRTLLGAEVAREFYNAPQRYVVGAPDGTFTDEQGKSIDGWKAVMGRLMDIPLNEDVIQGVDVKPQLPQVGQFLASSPAPYFDQIRGYAQMVAAEAAIPAPYLGFVSDNPASADAIRAAEQRLVSRAERRQKQFGRAWAEAARLVLLYRDGSVPKEAFRIRPDWRSAATPTAAASADAAGKIVAAGIVPATSEVAQEFAGLDERQKGILREEARRDRAAQMTQSMGVAAAAAMQDPTVKALVANRGTGTA